MIIFDLDGTLLDTSIDLHNALNYALKAHNLSQKTKQETLSYLGNGIDILVAKALENGKQNKDYPAVFNTFKTYYEQHLNDYTAPYKDIIELLTILKNKNYKLGIISNKFDEAVQELHQKFFQNLIDQSLGTSATISKKPSPDGIKLLIQQQNAINENNIFIGDSEIDIQTAHNANIPCISVSWGFRDREFLKSHNAIQIIDTPLDLLKILE
ncbi:MAG: HAD family hydrolase [Alphaproteobacteria bacterium]|nr:HAD family hydrolase [Alphaproteobacteria bacterium]